MLKIKIMKLGFKSFMRGAVIVIAVILAVFLIYPMFAGVVQIILQGGEPGTIPSVSQGGVTGLIFASTALGAFMVWFAAGASESNKRMISVIGKFFLFAALSFSLFMLLSPLLPDITSKSDFYSIFLRYVTGISFMGGGVSFAWATLFGLVYIWKV